MFLTKYAGATSITVLLLASLLMLPDTTFGQKIPSLKDAFKKDFGIGTALNTAQIEGRDPQTTAFIVSQFNMATPENIMKSALLHPIWDAYNFELADKLIEFGKKHNIKIN